MAKFKSISQGVVVMDDEGRKLGVAHGYGRPLSGAEALAQVGYVEDPKAPGGVRSAGGAFRADPDPDPGIARQVSA
jgi:hypothetical protein